MKTLILAAVAALSAGLNASAGVLETYSGEAAEASAIWSAMGGRSTLRLDPGLMANYELELSQVKSSSPADVENGMGFKVLPLGSLEFWAPKAAFDGFRTGRLVHEGGFTLNSPLGSVSLKNFALRPSTSQELSLELVNANGDVLFIADHIHTMLYPKENRMTLWNMDLRVAAFAAKALGYPELEGEVLGQAFTDAELSIPSMAATKGVCSSPNYHDGNNFLTDVALINIGSVGQRAREAGVRVAIAPSATLRNVGTADVPWVQKFTTPANGSYPEPYNRDQHPFLVWAMYRLQDDGLFRQIAVSEAKHAFFTVNTACACSGGSILWLGCEDIYGQGNNDSPIHLGPRDEIPALTGAWEQCGSFFAPGETPPGPCSQTESGFTNDEFERRMVVDEGELASGDDRYWSEAWYLIRDDIDIFNSMGHRRTQPTQSMTTGNWTFALDPFVNGAALDAWVPPGSTDFDKRHQRVSTANGHFSVAVRALDIGGGMTRLVYAVMNYDYDNQFRSFFIASNGDLASNLQAHTPDGQVWTPTKGASELRWDAPAGEGLDWGHMITFAFDVPTAIEVGTVMLQALESAGSESVTSLVFAPDDDLMFRSSFE